MPIPYYWIADTYDELLRRLEKGEFRQEIIAEMAERFDDTVLQISVLLRNYGGMARALARRKGLRNE